MVASAFGPLFLGLTFHGLCLRFGWLHGFARPIDGGASLRGRPLFGPNKTWRGVLAVAIGTAVGYGLLWISGVYQEPLAPPLALWQWLAVGASLGAAAMLSELPNSLLKRQLNVPAGGVASGWLAPLLYLVDQVDFLVGGWIVTGPVFGFSARRLVWSVAFVAVVHQLISLAGARLRMRASAR